MEESHTLVRTSDSTAVDFFQNRYFYISRFFMVLIGQWPYDRSTRRLFKQAFVILWGLLFINSQIAKLILTTEIDLDLVLDVFTPLMICILCYTKYLTCWAKADIMRELLDHIRYDWSVSRVWGEKKLLEKYSEEARLYILAYLIFTYSGIALFVNIQLLPNALDIIFPLNESRSNRLPFEGEFFVNNEEYFSTILIYMTMSVVIVLTLSSSADFLFINVVVHGSGLFGILGYRLEHMFNDLAENKFEKSTQKERVLLCQRIVDCVVEHRKSIDYVRTLNDCYAYSMVLQTVFTLFILTSTLLKMVESLTRSSRMDDTVVCTLHASGYIFLIFLNVLPTQMLLDTSTDIVYRAYSARWYVVPVQVQRLLLIVMRKGREAYGINAANLLTSSLEVFGTVIQTCISYFTVLYSLRQS